MPTYEAEIDINKPTTLVFNYLRDFEKRAEWQDGTGSITIVPDGSIRVGSMVTQERKRGGHDLLFNADVTEFLPNKKIEFKGVQGHYRIVDMYEVFGSGGTTRLKMVRDVQIGLIGRIFSPFLGRRTRSLMKNDLHNLKRVMEA